MKFRNFSDYNKAFVHFKNAELPIKDGSVRNAAIKTASSIGISGSTSWTSSLISPYSFAEPGVKRPQSVVSRCSNSSTTLPRSNSVVSGTTISRSTMHTPLGTEYVPTFDSHLETKETIPTTQPASTRPEQSTSSISNLNRKPSFPAQSFANFVINYI